MCLSKRVICLLQVLHGEACYFVKKAFKPRMYLCHEKQGNWIGKSSSVTSLKTGEHIRWPGEGSGALFPLAHGVRVVPGFPGPACGFSCRHAEISSFTYTLSRRYACNSFSWCSHVCMRFLINLLYAVRQSFAECNSGLYFFLPFYLCCGGVLFFFNISAIPSGGGK